MRAALLDAPDSLFGKLVPFKNGKLVRQWATSLRKDDMFYSLGTYKECDIRIRGFKSVEPYHCTVRYDFVTGSVSVKNSSMNGTWVNGTLLSGSQEMILRDNDKVALGAPILPSSRVFVFESCLPEGNTLAERYSVDWYRPIGKGSYGMVWKARKRRCFGPQSYRAIKALYFETGDIERRSQISEELRLCSLLQHPNICTFHEVIQDTGSNKMYIVLELISGGNLDKYVQRMSCSSFPGIGITTARNITRQICSAVDYMHKLSIVHRDLKPANILVDTSTTTIGPTIKITDFGLSKQIVNSAALRTVCGTPDFVAPEVMDSYYGESVDSWSIGAIVVFMLTRATPFVWTTLKGRDLWLNMACRKLDLASFEKTIEEDQMCIHFVRQLLRTLPNERMCVGNALRHAWLL